MKQFFLKDGMFSKTATILVTVWAVAILKWCLHGLHVGAWEVTFNSSDALTMTGAASTLYFTVHNVTRFKSSGGT